MSTVVALEKHPVVSREEWLAARTALLAKEKEFTRLRDELSAARRALPWERVEKTYVFDTTAGQQTLAELFGDRSQLIVYHFMFNPLADEGCPHCSWWADNFDDQIVHLRHRDITMVAASRAPLAKLEAFKGRMGWSFNWVSSGEGDFNYDYQASFRPEEVRAGKGFYNYQLSTIWADREGVSVFYKDAAGAVYHTYSTYARGIDLLNTGYNYIDLTPKGRDENGRNQSWLRYHDRYED